MAVGGKRNATNGKMIQAFEAIVDETGNIKLLKPVKLPSSSRLLITVLDEKLLVHINEEALLSESALAKDLNRPEEDETWEYLQSKPSS